MLTGLCLRLAHQELLLDERLGVNRTVLLLLGPVLRHIVVVATKELICGGLHALLLVLSLLSIEATFCKTMQAWILTFWACLDIVAPCFQVW